MITMANMLQVCFALNTAVMSFGGALNFCSDILDENQQWVCRVTYPTLVGSFKLSKFYFAIKTRDTNRYKQKT